MQFLEYQVLNERNLLCKRIRFTREAVTCALCSIEASLKEMGDEGAKRIYCILEKEKMEQVVLCVSSQIELTHQSLSQFEIKTELHLEQAVKTRHEGGLFDIEKSISGLKRYLESRKLEPITPVCCKVIAGVREGEFGNVIVDMYIGTNRNKL